MREMLEALRVYWAYRTQIGSFGCYNIVKAILLTIQKLEISLSLRNIFLQQTGLSIVFV